MLVYAVPRAKILGWNERMNEWHGKSKIWKTPNKKINGIILVQNMFKITDTQRAFRFAFFSFLPSILFSSLSSSSRHAHTYRTIIVWNMVLSIIRFSFLFAFGRIHGNKHTAFFFLPNSCYNEKWSPTNNVQREKKCVEERDGLGKEETR